MLENGLEQCTCPKSSCERHGNCAACIAYHDGKRRPPYCKRKPKERTRRGTGRRSGKAD